MNLIQQQKMLLAQIRQQRLQGSMIPPLTVPLSSPQIFYNNGVIAPLYPPCDRTKSKPLEKLDTFGPLLAYRVWTLSNNGCLGSIASGPASWPFGELLRARCIGYGDHIAPQSGCGCGIWGLKNDQDAVRTAQEYAGNLVVGEVALWGRVIVCQRGYRAEYAYPVKIFVGHSSPMPGFPRSLTRDRQLQKVVENYGCVVVEGRD